MFYNKRKKKRNRGSLNYTFATDVVDDCYPGSNLIDGRRCTREPGRNTVRLRRFQVFIVLRVRRRARDTKSGRMVVLENFDRLQLCSFSLSSRCSSRKATLACTRLRACTSLSHRYFTAYTKFTSPRTAP